MPITATNPFKGRHYPGEVILSAVRWYLRYPLAYLHVSELLAERGLFVDASCVWRWVQAYAPEINRRCRRYLKPTNKSYRVDETYIKVKGARKVSLSSGRFHRADNRFPAHRETRPSRCPTLLSESLPLLGPP